MVDFFNNKEIDLRIFDGLNLQDPITAERFIYIDDEVPIQELTEEEIVKAVGPNPEVDNSDEEEEVETGSYF